MFLGHALCACACVASDKSKNENICYTLSHYKS